jgi:ketosteroid isomerase-like protein
VVDPIERAWNGYAVLKRRDLEGFLALVDPEVEFRSLIAEAEGREYRGHEGVREWWESVAGAMGGLRFEPTAIHEFGEGVCAELSVTGIVEGVEVPQRMWQAVRFRGDKIRSWTVVRSEDEAHAWLSRDELP